MIAAVPITNRIAAEANSAQPYLLSPTITPKVLMKAAGIRSIATISTTLVSGVGFSNGWALLALKAPPPVTGHQLYRLPRCNGAAGNGLASAGQTCNGLRTMQIVDHPEREQDQRDDNRQRKKDAHRHPHQVDPEVAELLAPVLRKPSDQRHRDAHSNRATGERVHSQTGQQPDTPERGSPGWFCQLVLVTNETAVLNASAGVIPGYSHGSGRRVCTSNSAYRKNTLTAENASTDVQYFVHRCLSSA